MAIPDDRDSDRPRPPADGGHRGGQQELTT